MEMFGGHGHPLNGGKDGRRLNGGTATSKMANNGTGAGAIGGLVGEGGSSRGHAHHPHYCLFGTLHLLGAMKLLLAIGLCALLALCVLEAIYFRRALFIMLIPVAVLLLSAVAILRSDPRLLWPIIGISFFHLFLDAYAILIFLFFFFFKPLYIIMVLNWAFDTLHTSKTPSYYAHCAAIFTFLSLFAAFNFWQLRISLRFQAYSEELLGSHSSATISTGTISAGTNPLGNSGNEANEAEGFGGKFEQNSQKQRCKILNEPPIVLAERRGGSANKTLLLCPSPALSQRGGMHQVRTAMGGGGIGGLGPRRPSLGDQRQFGTR